MKYFVFSDAHGDYDALMKAVAEYGYEEGNAFHTLISCGDNFGRAETGKGSKGIYDYLTSSVHKNAPICLTGNHELILRKILFRRSLSEIDVLNGEDRTVYSFLGKNPETDTLSPYDLKKLGHGEVMDWLLNLPYYFETENHLFLHGFLPFDTENLRFITENLSDVGEEIWQKACWSKTPLMIMKFEHDYPGGLDKTVVFGHWHNAELRERFDKTVDEQNLHSIWRNDKLKLCGLDCCTVVSHRIEMLVVEA